MKQLILVRHGKSSWNYEVGDKDRPLQERGINDAHLVAGAFNSASLTVDAAYSSPANRALHTAMIFLRTLGFSFDKFEITDELYDFSGESVMTFVLNLDNALNTVLIFGHNYAFTEVANRWGNEAIGNVPTSGLVHLKFDTDDWNSIEHGTTEHFLSPKQFK